MHLDCRFQPHRMLSGMVPFLVFGLVFADNCNAGVISLSTFGTTGRSYHDRDFDGVYEGIGSPEPTSYIIASTNSVVTRTAFEYDLAQLPSSDAIQSAYLRFEYHVISNDPLVEIRGFSGDGREWFSDADAGGLLGVIHAPSETSFDVTSYVKGLLDSSQRYAGFSMGIQDSYPPKAFARQAWIATKFDPRSLGPTLEISTVPEPSTCSIFLVVAAIAGIRRNRCR